MQVNTINPGNEQQSTFYYYTLIILTYKELALFLFLLFHPKLPSVSSTRSQVSKGESPLRTLPGSEGAPDRAGKGLHCSKFFVVSADRDVE